MDQDIRLHDNNKDFAWSIPEGPYNFFSEEDINNFDEKGFIVLEDAFSPAEVEEVIGQIDPVSYTHLTLPTKA